MKRLACMLACALSAAAGENAPASAAVRLHPVVRDGKWGYMDGSGKVAIEPQYEAAYDFSEGLACVIVNGWRGFIDSAGKMAIPPQFAWAGQFQDGFAPVYDEKSAFAGRPQFYRPSGGTFCCVDRTGKTHRFGCSTAGFSEGRTVSGRNQCVGTNGQVHAHDAEALYLFSEGLAGARKGGLWGFLDLGMAWAIPPRFHAVDRFAEGLAPVAMSDVPPPESGPSWEWSKKAILQWGFCDRTGRLVIACRYPDAWPFAEGLAAVKSGPAGKGKWGYIDKTGKQVIAPAFDYAWPFSEGRGRVQVGDRQGFIDTQGNIVIEPRYQPAWEFSGGLARVRLDGREGYIDRQGKTVWEPSR